MKELISRIKGGILGLAIGDALGAPVEMQSSRFIKEEFGVLNNFLDKRYWKGEWTKWEKGKWTDDTAFTLEIIKSIIEKQKIDPEDISNRFFNLAESGELENMLGGTTIRAMKAIGDGYSWEVTGKIAMREEIQGAGGLMRSLPIGIFLYRFPRENQIQSRNVCRITHASPLSTDACVVYNTIVGEVLLNDLSIEEIRKVLEQIALSAEINSEVSDGINKALKTSKNEIAPFKDREPNILSIFETSLWIFLNSINFEDALVISINIGGDIDTIAAVTGGLLGIYYGLESIPKRWLRKLSQKKEINTLINELCKLIAG